MERHPSKNTYLSRVPKRQIYAGVFGKNFDDKSTPKLPQGLYLSAFRGCGARNVRPTNASAAPTALRSRGGCPPLWCGICQDFSLVSAGGIPKGRMSTVSAVNLASTDGAAVHAR